jgi:hypothetical protein
MKLGGIFSRVFSGVFIDEILAFLSAGEIGTVQLQDPLMQSGFDSGQQSSDQGTWNLGRARDYGSKDNLQAQLKTYLARH